MQHFLVVMIIYLYVGTEGEREKLFYAIFAKELQTTNMAAGARAPRHLKALSTKSQTHTCIFKEKQTHPNRTQRT